MVYELVAAKMHDHIAIIVVATGLDSDFAGVSF
jgi:hypothetical protein